MKRKLGKLFMLCVMAILFSIPSGAKAATIGEKLISPENGWTRFDDSNACIQYTGTGLWTHGSYSTTQYYMGTDTYMGNNQNINIKSLSCDKSTHCIKFKFYGSKIRLIGYYSKYGVINCNISIDGVIYNFSQYNSLLDVQSALNYESPQLTLGIHDIEIYAIDSASYFGLVFDAVDINDNGYLINSNLSCPLNLSAKSVDGSTVNLSWNSVTNATGYNLKRSTAPGGPYTIIRTGSDTTFSDLTTEKGTTYYYVVSAVNSIGESIHSSEVSINLSCSNTILEITMTNGVIKEYSLTGVEFNSFLTWYDNRSNGIGKSYFKLPKKSNVKPFLARYEYVNFDKIFSFEEKDFNE